MKMFIVLSMMVAGLNAFADGAGTGAEEVIAAGGLTTVVGGCANAVTVGSGENTEIVYTGPCNNAPTAPLNSDFKTVFATHEQALAHCRPQQGYVQSVLNWKFQVIGYVCAPQSESSGE